MSAAQELQNYIFISKYARWDETKQRRETWREAVDRVRSMMLRKYHDKDIDDDINWAYDMMFKKKILGSQRALQFGGAPIEKINTRIFNCSSSYCDRLRFFQEALFVLLCGSGTGVSIQKHHVKKLPKLYKGRKKKLTYQIPDDIEGWADALGVLMSSYFESPVFKDYYGSHVTFDPSLVREKGSYLSSGTGKAPGPEPLMNALERIRKLLESCKDRLTPIQAGDIILHSADAVLSGGVRRSAVLLQFSPDDEEMVKAKRGNWRKEQPQRGRSNNSALILRENVSKVEFKNLIENAKQYGEPGIIFSDSMEMVVNPCAEIGMYPRDVKTGKSGWSFCNLSTINCGTLKDKEDFFDRCRAASFIGSLQAGFTTMKYLGKTTENIVKREALIGVSMTAIMENTEIVLDPAIQRAGAKFVIKTNKDVAAKIGINQAARTTCTKPEGTSSLLLGGPAGIGANHAKRWIRIVQANEEEIPYKLFKKINPKACEHSVWSANDTDGIISFPIEAPDGSKLKGQLTALKFLEMVKTTQQNWVLPGTNKELCTQPYLNHNVSNTVTVKPDEWNDVINYLYKHRKYFTGVSLIPASGDKDYPQPPFTAIHLASEITREYGEAALWTSGLIELALQAFNKNLWAACDFVLANQDDDYSKVMPKSNGKARADKLVIEHGDYAKKMKFVHGFKKFAHRYFDDNIQRLTYCLKDIYNRKKYVDLEREFKPVDYSTLVETEDNTKALEEVACQSGFCEF